MEGLLDAGGDVVEPPSLIMQHRLLDVMPRGELPGIREPPGPRRLRDFPPGPLGRGAAVLVLSRRRGAGQQEAARGDRRVEGQALGQQLSRRRPRLLQTKAVKRALLGPRQRGTAGRVRVASPEVRREPPQPRPRDPPKIRGAHQDWGHAEAIGYLFG